MATLHDRNDQCVRFPLSVTYTLKSLIALLQSQTCDISGAPNENIVQNHLNIALLNVF